MLGVAIVSPLNKRVVRGDFNLRVKYSGDPNDKELAIYANGDLVAVFTPATKIPLSNLQSGKNGKVKLSVALIEKGTILSQDSINIIYQKSAAKNSKSISNKKSH